MPKKQIAIDPNAVSLFVNEPNPLYFVNLFAEERIVVNQGGTYSSKSYSIMQVLLTLACSELSKNIVVAGFSIPKLKEDVMKIAASIVAENPVIRRYVKSFHIQDRRYEFITGSTIEFKSYEDAEGAKGGKFDYLYISEATRFDFATCEILIRNCIKKVFIDYNPSFRFWVHDILLVRKKQYPSVRVVRSWHEHNNYLSDDKHREIESIEDPEMWKVYARGLTGKLKGLVFSWEVVDEFPTKKVKEVIWGIDWGYTSDPTAICRIACMEDGSFVCDEVLYVPMGELQGEPTSYLIYQLEQGGYREEPVYADHDQEMIINMRRGGVMVYPAEKGVGAELNRVLHVKTKRVKVTARSKNLRRELMMYKFVEVDGMVTNRIVKGNDHAIDSCTMAIYTHRHRGVLIEEFEEALREESESTS